MKRLVEEEVSRALSAGPTVMIPQIPPAVSVILPVHNGERYLPEAIDSVLNQTFSDFELIVVDDGSTDLSPRIVSSALKRDGRVRLIRQKHQGVSVARNLALHAAQADWIACLDHDDVMLPERLERQLAFAADHPGVAAFGSVALYINSDGAVIGRTVPAPIRSRDELDAYLLTGELIGLNQPSVMMSRAAVLDVGGYHPEMIVGQDMDLWMRLAQAGYLVLQQDEILTKYRVHSKSVTATFPYASYLTSQWVTSRAEARRHGRPEPTLQEFEEHWRSRPIVKRMLERRRHLGWVYYRRAGTALANHEWGRGVGYLLLAFVLGPVNAWHRLSKQIGPLVTSVSKRVSF